MDGAPVHRPTEVIMQPTSLCNMNCVYCYLPARSQRNVMSLEVACATARAIEACPRPVDVVWHGGEPLTLGVDHLGVLMDCFPSEGVIHSVQTNATLIDAKWCRFFTNRTIQLGVSLDGAEVDNAGRVDWAGRPTYHRTVRGIRQLVDAGHEVAVIAVVSDPTPERARRLYTAVAELGCRWLGVNIEEQEGVNDRRNAHPFEQVRAFWTALTETWHHDRRVQLRDVDRALAYSSRHLRGDVPGAPVLDPLPTVAYDGAVTLISPELAGFNSARLGPFSCGNITEHGFDELIETGLRQAWVSEYRDGIEKCRVSCEYFDFCGGAHPANRFFEQDRFDGTETDYCRNTKMALMDGVLTYAQRI